MLKAVVQIVDEAGNPAGGHAFIAPDQETLDASMADLPEGRWHLVDDESQLVIPPPPDLPVEGPNA